MVRLHPCERHPPATVVPPPGWVRSRGRAQVVRPFGHVTTPQRSRPGSAPPPSASLLAKLGLERRTQAAVLATRLLGEHPHS